MASSPTQRPASRERLLDAAVELLRVKGPTASGTKEILTRADAPRGSFYFHFPDGKDQLVAEAVQRAGAATRASLETALADRSVALPQRIESFFEAVAGGVVADDYQLGCAVGATVLEAAATSAVLRSATESVFASWTSTLVDVLSAEGLTSDRAAALADTVVAALEGATMLARSRRDPAPLLHVAGTLSALVTMRLDEAAQAT